MTIVEPEWDQRAVDEILASMKTDDLLCRGCSNDLRLSTDDDVARKGIDVDDTSVCWGCAAKAQYKRSMEKKHENDPSWWDGRTLIASLPEAGD